VYSDLLGKNDRLGNTWYINDENIANLARPEERQQDSLYGLKSVFNVLNRSIRSAGNDGLFMCVLWRFKVMGGGKFYSPSHFLLKNYSITWAAHKI
jgi:hypothetical protein